MKHTFTFFAVLMTAMALPKVASAYDLSYMLPNGSQLYFNIVDGHAVVTYPEHVGIDYWWDHGTPWGSITIPDSVTYNGTHYVVTAIGDHAFSGSDELTSVTLPSHITQIGAWAFYDCNALSSVSMPSSLVTIGKSSFRECTSLASIVIPNNVVYIGSDAFNTCTNLSAVTLGNSVETIDTTAFCACSNLSAIVFPNSLISIKNRAFCNSGLTSVTFGNASVSIEADAFRACQLYNPVSIPSTVSSIGENAFYHAKMLYYDGSATGSPWGALCVNGHIEDSLYYTSVDKDTLTGAMIEITTANIPNTVNRIGPSAFEDCESLTSVSIPNSVNSIGNFAFLGCHGLSTVTIPASVDTIEYFAFLYCLGLRHITFEGTNPPIGDDFWYLDTAFIPCGSLAAYSTAMPQVSNFVVPEFSWQFSATSEDETKGTVMVTTAPSCAAPAVVTAIALEGYQFSQWSNGSQENPLSIIVNSDTALVAYFNEPIVVYIYDTVTIHDTVFVDIPYAVHDTTVVTDTVTMTEYVPVHDTTYIDVPVHDTTYVNVPYPVHDTTVVTLIDTVVNTVFDTIVNTVFDTVVNTVYDTTIIDNYIYDTTIVDNYIYDTLNITDTLWLTQTDTLWLRDTIIIHDTIYITPEGVDGVDALNAKVYSSQGQIVVEGAEGNMVWIYDINGRILATKRDDYSPLHFDVPASGTYMIKIGQLPANKIVVIR